MVGIFITIVSLIIALYFIQLGARRGAFPVLLTCLVTFAAFVIAINYRFEMAHMMIGWFKLTNSENYVSLGYLSLFAVFFCLFGYVAIRFSPEIAPMFERLDKTGGGVLGAIAGLLITGSLCTAWFGSSLATRFSVPEGSFYFKPHVYLLHTYGYITGSQDTQGGDDHFARFPGGAWFDAKATTTGMLQKGSSMPRGGDGFWISSVPQGSRIFISTVRGLPKGQFVGTLEGSASQEWNRTVKDNTSTIRGYAGLTPTFVRTDAPEAWVAVEIELSPRDPAPGAGENILVEDGQADVYYYGPQRRFMKVYKLYKDPRNAEVRKLISLMYKPSTSMAVINDLLPTRPLVKLPDDKHTAVMAELVGQGLSDSEAKVLVTQLERGGKIMFTARNGQKMTITIIHPDGDYETKTLGG